MAPLPEMISLGQESKMERMNEATLNALKNLCAALDNDPRVLLEKQTEDAALQSKQAQDLAKKKDEAAAIYDEAIAHFGEDSAQTRKAQHDLYLAKQALDLLPEVAAYRKAYLQVALLYKEIDKIVLGPYREVPRCLHD